MKKLTALDMHRLSVEQFHEAPKLPLVVVLDNVRSLYNVGSVFRTGDAFRILKLCLCGITATPPHPEIHKTALGGEDSVSWEYYKDTLDCLHHLRAEGYTILCVEQAQGSTMLGDFHPASGERYAVILGNEVKGVQQQVVDQSDGCLEIPQYGTKHSLNISVTAGIVIWHFANAPGWFNV